MIDIEPVMKLKVKLRVEGNRLFGFADMSVKPEFYSEKGWRPD